MEIQMGNGSFIWTNKRKGLCNIIERLDIYLFKGDLGSFSFSLEGNIMSIFGSNHYPIHLDILGERKTVRCLFKFEKYGLETRIS